MVETSSKFTVACHDKIHGDVVWLDGELRKKLDVEAYADLVRIRCGTEQPVVETAASAEPFPAPGKRNAGNDHKVDLRAGDLSLRDRGRFAQSPARGRLQFVSRTDLKKLEFAAGDAGVCESLHVRFGQFPERLHIGLDGQRRKQQNGGRLLKLGQSDEQTANGFGLGASLLWREGPQSLDNGFSKDRFLQSPDSSTKELSFAGN